MTASDTFTRPQHSDAKRYVVYVLWLVGHSQRSIAAAVNLRIKQVAGIIQNSEYRDRAGMSDDRRASLLAELHAIRCDADGSTLDRGRLNRVPFEIRPLGARQSRGVLSRKVRRGR